MLYLGPRGKTRLLEFPSLPFAITIIILFGFIYTTNAQEENIWAFGAYAGIDFNGGTARAIKTGIATREGSSSVCNANGQLLFYTDGFNVWDKNHNIMPRGKDLTQSIYSITASTTQGTIIIPMPGEQDQYYIFSLGEMVNSVANSPFLGKLYYSIVDMTLNGGLGDVARKGILLDSLLTEQMTAVSGNNCDAWLIVVSRTNNNFKSYNISINGVESQPVISKSAREKELTTTSEILGSIDISPDRSKLAIAQDKVILYDFNPGSGEVTHPVILDSLYIFNFFSSFYGLCFSPDNTKLYVSLPEPPFGISPALFQFDLSAGDSIAIINSKRIISENPVFALKRAPDGRVYGADVRANTLHIIINPNITGIGCQYIANGFLLLNGTQSYCGLPNLGVLSPSKKYTLTIDSALCSQPRILKAKNHFGQNYVWEDGSSGHTRTVNNAGVYWVRYQVPVNTPCKYEYYIDTFKVIFGFISKDVYTTIKDSGMCNADTISISATNFNGSGYVWHDGYMGVHRKVNQTGIYYLSYLIDSICEHHVDSFIISYPTPPYKVSFDADTLVCVMDTFSFQNTSAPYFNNFIWSFGDLDSSTLIIPQHTYTHPGSYQVILVGHIGEICPDTAYRIIIADPIFETRFIKDKDSICQGESIMFTHKMNTKTITDLHWQMSDGNDFSTFDNQIKHAYDHSGIMPLMLTAQFRACPQSSFTDTIYVSALPKVNLGIESQLCLHGIPIVLKNLQPPPKEAYYTLWNTGDTTETLKIVSPGIYSLTVKTEPLGCSATESIMVHKGCRTDIPNAFTPNGDGINDFFFPRRLFSNGVQAFHMQVLNRWGQLLFETRNIDGRGWNGRYNNLEQPAEVYVYTIEIEFENGFKEKYMGNVTLMR